MTKPKIRIENRILAATNRGPVPEQILMKLGKPSDVVLCLEDLCDSRYPLLYSKLVNGIRLYSWTEFDVSGAEP